MSREPGGAFEYSTTVPLDGQNAFPWEMKSREPFVVGESPLLYIREAGLPPNPGLSVPSVVRNEIRLVATDKKHRSREMGSYFLDQALVRALRSGDIFHIVRTDFGGVGVSAIRQGKLVFAVGEVTVVPLGSDISVKIPYNLVHKAEEIFRQRDPKFEFPDYPVEVCVGDSPKIWYRGLVQIGDYHIWVEHGVIPCDGTIPESVSITLDEACDWVAGSASAQLLALC